jgi:formylglycine-generating enzyme required for sulfatase activity
MGLTEERRDAVVAQCLKERAEGEDCKGWFDASSPRHEVWLDEFWIDRLQVTNADFERFVKATGHVTLGEQENKGAVRRVQDGKWGWFFVDGATWRTPQGPDSTTQPSHPVLQVNWHDAVAYCRWAGKQLPTEAQWEKAARGTDERMYAWGSNWDNASHSNSDKRIAATTPVGQYPSGASPYGALDMTGNVWEWTQDWYSPTYYAHSEKRNPTGPESGKSRVLRGASWHHSSVISLAAFRITQPASSRTNLMGIRCAQN